jgi:hypothetical protein
MTFHTQEVFSEQRCSIYFYDGTRCRLLQNVTNTAISGKRRPWKKRVDQNLVGYSCDAAETAIRLFQEMSGNSTMPLDAETSQLNVADYHIAF